MKIKNTAIILRKDEDGGNLLFGKGLKIPKEIECNKDYLILGHLDIDDLFVFRDFIPASGDTPDNMLYRGGLDFKNYKERLK